MPPDPELRALHSGREIFAFFTFRSRKQSLDPGAASGGIDEFDATSTPHASSPWPQDVGLSGPDGRPGARSGLQALCVLARLHHLSADAAALGHQLGRSETEAISSDDLLLAARALGLKARLRTSRPDRLTLVPLPALCHVRLASGETRWVVLAQCDGQRVLFLDPLAQGGGRPTIEPLATFAELWTGELILATSQASLAGELAKFDFSWFIPSLVKHRRLLGEVLTISLCERWSGSDTIRWRGGGFDLELIDR